MTIAFAGGPVMTMDARGTVLPPRSAIVAESGVIAELTGPAAAEAVHTLDFGERPLLPAFLDIHAHLGMTTMALSDTVDCHSPPRASIDEIVEALRADIGLSEARGGWLVGVGSLFQDRKLTDGRLPTRTDLDRVSTTIPIALRCGGHVTVLNTRALELAGFGDRPLPAGAAVDSDSAGVPTGVVRELFEYLPLPEPTRDQRKRALRDMAHQLFTENGVTYLGEISQTVEDVECIAELVAEDAIGARVDVFTWVPATLALEAALRMAAEHESGDPRFRMRGIKLFSDGGFSASTAAVKRPYRGTTGEYGSLAIDRPELARILAACRAAGQQLIVHTNGERAQDAMCRAVLETVGRERDPHLRTRIEHAGNFVSDPATVELWLESGVGCVAQPCFLYTFGDYFPDYLGDYARDGRFPFRDLAARGIELAASSDVSGSEVRHANPFFNAWCAVERRGFRGELICPEQAIGVMDALAMQTRIAADVAGLGHERGSLERRKAADLVVLDRDPRDVPGAELPDVRIDHVVRAGRVIHSRPGAAPYDTRTP